MSHCPICGSKTKSAGHTVFCQCGWHKSLNQAQKKQVQKIIIKNLILAGFFIMGSFFYISEWGTASLSIVPLKARQWTGLLNQNSYEDLKSICLKLKKYDCVEKAHLSYFHSSKNLEVLHALGEFQYRRGLLNEAKQTYTMYFTQKGTSIKAAYIYAKVLEKAGQHQSALEYYLYALKAQPNVAQVTVMKSYINLLKLMGQHQKAEIELKKFQSLVKKSTSLVQNNFKNWKRSNI